MALVEKIKTPYAEIIERSGEALRKAYKKHIESEFELTNHLKNDNIKIRNSALYTLSFFGEERYHRTCNYEWSTIDAIIPFINSANSYYRELAIRMITPCLKKYFSIIKDNNVIKGDKNQLSIIKEIIVQLTDRHKHDLDEDVRKKSCEALKTVGFSCNQ